MRQPLSGDDRNITQQVMILLTVCFLTVPGLGFVAEQGRTSFYHLTGNVVSIEENKFGLTVILEESNVDVPLAADAYCFEMKDFQSRSSIPAIGDVVSITCNHDLSVLTGIYNADDLPD